MIGVKKLQVPSINIQPKLYCITIVRDSVQHRYFRIAMSLSEAILGYWYRGKDCTLSEYVCHNEISINEINSKFKNYMPCQI